MARSRKLSPERKAFINSLIEHYHPEDAQDVQEMLKDLLGDTLQGMFEAEMDAKLCYTTSVLNCNIIWIHLNIFLDDINKFMYSQNELNDDFCHHPAH